MAQENQRAGERRGVQGVRLSVINNIMIFAAVLIAAVLLYAVHRATADYNRLQSATERYITCQQNADIFQEASDYLTNECRFFTVLGDPVHARNFIEEVEVTKRRDGAIAGVADYLKEAQSYDYLVKGMEYSNALAEVECYAIRLVAEAYGIDPGEMPEEIMAIGLDPEDAALDAEAQRSRAFDLLFGEDYQAAKARIHECVESSINAFVDDTRAVQIDASSNLRSTLRRQAVLIVAMLVALACVVAFTYVLVIRPLQRSVVHIRSHSEIPVAGSSEMQFLARTYNDMYAQHARSTEKLTYSATHDSLTGVYNRTAYDAQCRELDHADIGVLIVDVDNFKGFNDNYGHDVGDRVLKRVAQVLTDSFRSEDFIGRIGGDEFCVIMKHVNSGMRELVAGKVARVNQRLMNPEDDLPRISLSVGVAFGDRKAPSGDIFKDADTALYGVKRQGGGGCGFFE